MDNDVPSAISLWESKKQQEKGATLDVEMLATLGHYRDIYITPSELEEAFSYFHETIVDRNQ
jgi:hypothetical protein